MFCVVDISSDSSQGSSGKKRLLSFSKRQRRQNAVLLNMSRVHQEGLPPFHMLSLPERRVLSDEAMSVYAAYRHKLLFPRDREVPEAVRPLLFTPKRFKRERMSLLAEETLGALPKKARLNAVFVRDNELVCDKALMPHMMKMSRLFILTGSDARFERFSAEALVRYGAVVYRGSSMPTQNRYDMLIDIDGGVINTSFGGQSDALRPKPVSLPGKLESILPMNCDREAIAAAMFEICGVLLDNG